MDNLRSKLIRLAHANPALRPQLLPLLRTASDRDEVMTPPSDLSKKTSLTAWEGLVRQYILGNSEPDSQERKDLIAEAAKQFEYSAFLLRKKPIGKDYTEASKRIKQLTDTVAGKSAAASGLAEENK